IENFHIYLHDHIVRDITWLTAPSPQKDSNIPVFDITMSRSSMAKFLSGSGKESNRPWVNLNFSIDKDIYHGQIRLRGTKHWHYLSKKKSMKIDLVPPSLYKGYSTFNLINEPDPMVIGQKLITDIAQENGILVPQSSFARVLLNGEDLGLYHFEPQPDGSLFRKNHLAHGALFSGSPSGSPSGSNDNFWAEPKKWKKVSSAPGFEKQEHFQISQFLKYINNSSFKEFEEFANRKIDMDAFAKSEAIDVVFGIEQHGYYDNQKIVYDDYTGKWKPVSFDLQGFRHDGEFNRAENPITLRLKMIPAYRALRNREVYKLITGTCSLNSVTNRAHKILKDLMPSIQSDRLITGFKLLPKINEFAFKMLRPLDIYTILLTVKGELTSFSKRISFLLNRLEQEDIKINKAPSQTVSSVEDNELYSTDFEIIIQRGDGVFLKSIEPAFKENCTLNNWNIKDSSGSLIAEDKNLNLPETNNYKLYTNAYLVQNNENKVSLRIELAPANYKFNIISSCKPVKINVFTKSMVTENTINASSSGDSSLQNVYNYPALTEIPSLAAGQKTPEYINKDNTIEDVTLGPGLIQIGTSLQFSSSQNVHILPGTTLELGEDVSLIFAGKVLFDGTKDAPIIIKNSGKKPFGGIALQGRQTEGSTFNYVTIYGGSTPHNEDVYYPAMINIHDTDNVHINHCDFKNNIGKGDMFHSGYADNLLISNSTISEATVDALDLEYSKVTINRTIIKNAGDEGVDLMDSIVNITDTIISSVKGNGISAGQQSRVTILNTMINNSKKGLLIKDASKATLISTLLFNNQTGIDLEPLSINYSGKIKFSSRFLYIVESDNPIRLKQNKKTENQNIHNFEQGHIWYGLSDISPLRHLFKQVLEIETSEELYSSFYNKNYNKRSKTR
ncbi:MAG: CotH kinase family protein, partial [Deltaproteobacteria bacterium]|nr:CotH kinase family protein [Deltaproteobacteria bacterium]